METSFLKVYNRLCQQKGMSASAVAEEIGLSNSTVTTWKQGALPRRPTIKKVASYFGISVEQMMGYEEITERPTPVSESGPTDQDLIKLWKSLSPDEILRVKDFALGMLAARKEPPSHPE